MELEVYDIVRIEGSSGGVYLESVNSIAPQANICDTDHFRINTDTLEVISDYGTDDDMAYELKQVWRKDSNKNYILVWDNGENQFDDKKPCPSERPSNIDYHIFEGFVSAVIYNEVCKERDELKEVVIEQAKEIYNLKQALKYKEN